jgi:hypothetical protein
MCGREKTCGRAILYVWQQKELLAHFAYVWQRKNLMNCLMAKAQKANGYAGERSK